MNLDIISRGDGWIGVDKPHGMSVHNDPGRDVISILTRRLNRPEVLQPVHRLDRDTSGVLLVATTPPVLKKLSACFQTGTVSKTYLALVHGHFEDTGQGIWTFPLSKQAGGRQNPGGSGKKVAASTRYEILDQSPHYTLLRICLDTGRKHQIRRHARMAGHPVVGDQRYGSVRALKFLSENRGFRRLGLHAAGLEIPDIPLTLSSPGLPGEIDALFRQDA